MAKAHKKPIDPDCQICNHDDRDMIEDSYSRFFSAKEISKTFGLRDSDITRHCKALKLDEKRVSNTKALYSRLLDKGIQNLGNMELSVKDLLKLAEHIDKLEGRVVTKHQVQAPEIIYLGAVPVPGVQSITAIPETPTLPPSAEPTLEADFGEKKETDP